MDKASKLSPSEKYVQNLLRDRYGLFVRKIDDMGGKFGKKPDFEYLENNKRIFVCELKENKKLIPSVEAGWKVTYDPVDGSIEGTRNPKPWNKISDSISEAYKQMEKYTEPKILIFLNHYPGLDVGDLEATFNGYFEYSSGTSKVRDYSYKVGSEGRIKDIKNKIDLIIWIDAVDKSSNLNRDTFYIRYTSEVGFIISKKYFPQS